MEGEGEGKRRGFFGVLVFVRDSSGGENIHIGVSVYVCMDVWVYVDTKIGLVVHTEETIEHGNKEGVSFFSFFF